MKAAMVMALAMLLGMASMPIVADDAHHVASGKAASNVQNPPKKLPSGGKACKDGACDKKGMGGMAGGCCCAGTMQGMMGNKCMMHGEGHGGMAMMGQGGMGQDVMMERMQRMEQRMDMMQSMLQKGTGGEMPR